MAVYEHTYRRYRERLTPAWSRFLVLPKYALRDVFKSRMLVFFYALTVLVPLSFGIFIYLRQNFETIQSLLSINFDIAEFAPIDAKFFGAFLVSQSQLAFFLALFIGPGLVSRDLTNNGLPLYLSRPISRADYVIGKVSILFILLSSITWVAGLLLFLLNGNFVGWGWMVENVHIAAAILITSLFWIGILSLLALALSAWVRLKILAAFGMLMFFWTGDMLSRMVNWLFRTDWGHIVNPDRLIHIIGSSLLGIQAPEGPPAWAATLALFGIMGLCLLMLHRKIRAYQVVS